MGYDYSVFLGNVGPCSDRFCSGYGEPFTIPQLFDRVASIEHLRAVDLVADETLYENEREVRESLKRTGLIVASVTVELFSQPKWKQGTFSSIDPKVRREAIDWTKRAIDFARSVDCSLVGIWPGQDGYDYIFQADYLAERGHFAEGVKEVCRHDPNAVIALEYKPREPRNRCYVSTTPMAILMAHEIGEPNIGVVLDYGHALYAYENPAESVALLHKYGNLLKHIHINDNYRYWDDDMIVGSVHVTELIEFFYWLKKTGYRGYLTIDQFPYREDGRDAVAESAAWLKKAEAVIDRADLAEIESVISKKDGILASRLARKLIFG